ncbi:MAG: GerMN domain-containing protein [Candidatus Aminicenantaceae bacterium]
MSQKRIIILGVLFSLLIIFIILFFNIGKKEKPQSLSDETSLLDSEEQLVEPKETRMVTLFFLSEDDGFLHSEKREIYSEPSDIDSARQTVLELIKGSQNGYISPFPPETKLRELFLTKMGIAYVDFSSDIMENHPSGSSAEISTVYSLVNTLTHNFKSIKKVHILVDGREQETLGGHINLSKPFLPMYDLVVQ